MELAKDEKVNFLTQNNPTFDQYKMGEIFIKIDEEFGIPNFKRRFHKDFYNHARQLSICYVFSIVFHLLL